MRLVWFAGGWVSVALGGLGIIVPGLPTTVFFIIAAWCFSKSSPRFERWVLDLPRVGPMVRAHRAGEGMPRKAKAWAIAMMVAFGTLSVFAVGNPALGGVILALVAVGAWYITTRVPTSPAPGTADTAGTSPPA
ncbi:MAG TPA: YbaN family protein [Acidimicrobiia bacterium]|nr:YbaN family protein [Acidimicrobiia bacterium]